MCEEPPVFDKSISGDLLFEMLSLFIGVEKIAYQPLQLVNPVCACWGEELCSQGRLFW